MSESLTPETLIDAAQERMSELLCAPQDDDGLMTYRQAAQEALAQARAGVRLNIQTGIPALDEKTRAFESRN